MRVCLFCDSTKLTLEHVWPEWVVALFAKLAPPNPGGFTATATLNRQTIRSWRTNTITHKAKVVCRSCNGGWMSDIETIAQPILAPLIARGERRTVLSLYERAALAAWMTVRSIVFDAIAPKGGAKYYTRKERWAFRDDPLLAPPAHTHIWLAPYIDTPYAANVSVMNAVARSGADTHVSTLVVNEIAAQLVVWRGYKWRRINHGKLARRGWGEVSRMIWPCKAGNFDDLQWPPPLHLSDRSVETFSDRFRPRRIG